MDQEKDEQRVGFRSFLVAFGLIVLHILACAVSFWHLAYDGYADNWLFPIALTRIGVGVVWQWNEVGIMWKVRGFVLKWSRRVRVMKIGLKK